MSAWTGTWTSVGQRVQPRMFRSLGLILMCSLSLGLSPGLMFGQAGDKSGSTPGLLLVASMEEAKVDIIDERTWQTVASVSTGARPHEVRVAPDGQQAYAVAGRTITAIDLRTLKVSGTFDLGEYSAHDVRVSRDGRRLWAACAGRQTVLELDAGTGAVLNRHATARDGAWFVEVSSDETRLYTPNLEGKSVSIIPRSSTDVTVLPFDHPVYGIDITPDGRYVWVSGRNLAVIDTATASLARIVATPQPDSGRLRITPDGARVVVAMERSLVVVDAADGRALRQIALAATPKVLTLSGDGTRAYVSNPEANSVTAVDLTAGRVLETIPAGRRPDGVGWAPRPTASGGG